MENARIIEVATIPAGRNASGHDVCDRVAICHQHGWASAPVPDELKEQPDLCPACLLDDMMARGRKRYAGFAQAAIARATQTSVPFDWS